MTAHPCFSLYARDWVSDTNLLVLEKTDPEALCVFYRLAWLSWTGPGLPTDESEIFYLIGSSNYLKIWNRIHVLFVTVNVDGRPRLFERRISTLFENRQMQSEANRKSANERK